MKYFTITVLIIGVFFTASSYSYAKEKRNLLEKRNVTVELYNTMNVVFGDNKEA